MARTVRIIPGEPYQQQTKLIEGMEDGLRAFLVPFTIEAKTMATLWAMKFAPPL